MFLGLSKLSPEFFAVRQRLGVEPSFLLSRLTHRDVLILRAQATAWMPEVEQRMEQLPNAQEQ